jgi:hypothetical protein
LARTNSIFFNENNYRDGACLCRVSRRTTPIFAIALFRVNAVFSAVGHHRRFCESDATFEPAGTDAK